jgi:hypothetical protein
MHANDCLWRNSKNTGDPSDLLRQQVSIMDDLHTDFEPSKVEKESLLRCGSGDLDQ